MRKAPTGGINVPHRHAWLWEPLEANSSFVLRPMFGTKAVYLDGKMFFGFCTNAEPWRGILVCTSREHHASLMAEFLGLKPHAVLGKWLYLSERLENFESTAERLIRLAQRRDPGLGIIPAPKKKKRAGQGRGEA